MWRFLAVSFPFCIDGTRAAAAAHSTVIAVYINPSRKIKSERERYTDTKFTCYAMSSKLALLILDTEMHTLYLLLQTDEARGIAFLS